MFSVTLWFLHTCIALCANESYFCLAVSIRMCNNENALNCKKKPNSGSNPKDIYCLVIKKF